MITVDQLGKELRIAGDVCKEALVNAKPEIETIAVSHMRMGMQLQTSPDGTPYPAPSTWRIRGGDKRLLDQGILAGSLAAMSTADLLTLTANAPGARVQHFGAVIVPVKAKALAIPLTKEALYAGSPRNFPQPLIPLKGGLATIEQVPGRRGKYSTRVKPKITMQYIFKMRVVIPATPYLGVSQDAGNLIGQTIAYHAMLIYNRKLGL